MTETFLAELPHRSLIRISGNDKVAFLQGLVTNDVNKVQEGKALYTALLTPQGKFLHDLFIISYQGDWLIDCEKERAADLIKRLSLYKLRSQVEIINCSQDYKVYAHWGKSQNVPSSVLVIDDPRLPALGQRIYVNTSEAPFQELSLFEKYDAYRLSFGIPDGSRDIPIEKGIILECGLDELHAIDWQKGCYMGQELTARTRYRGLVRKRLLPVKINGVAPPPFSPVFLNGEEIGEMRTSALSYGLALLRLELIRDTLPTLTSEQAVLSPFIPDWMQLPEQENKNLS